MRHSFLGRWICLPVSESFRLVWKYRLFDYSTYIQFCVHWLGGECLQRLVLDHNYVILNQFFFLYFSHTHTNLTLTIIKNKNNVIHIYIFCMPFFSYSIFTSCGIYFPFFSNIYIYIYIYVIHRQICFVLSELISVARQYLPVAGIETRLTKTSSQRSNHSATRRY